MSDDTVDDLHAAEDFAGRAVAVLQALYLVAPHRAGDEAVLSDVRSVLTGWAEYCRPTCNPNDDGPHDEVCEEGATCDCPCRDRAQDDLDREPPERELPGDEP